MNIKIILAVFSVILSGAAGLVYEVTWHKYLCNLLGSQAKASAVILSIFLGGLSLGYLIFGKVSKNKNQGSLLRLAAWAELAIGTWAIFFPIIYILIWEQIRILPSSGFISFILEILISAVLILPPTILMGSTLPLLTKGLVNNSEASKSIHALIYSINTFGAFTGTLLSGFYILPEYGLSKSIQGSSILNFSAGLLLLICATNKSQIAGTQNDSSDTAPVIKFKAACFIVTVLGFCSLSLQTCLIRLLGLSAGSSEYSFTIVVSMFVLLLAVGAMSVRKMKVNNYTLSKNLLISLIGLLIIYCTAENWPYYCYVIRSLLKTLEPNFYVYHAALLIGLSAFCYLAIAYLGRSLPIVFASVVQQHQNSGDTVGILYSLNAFGCILGAIIGGYLLLYYVDLYFVFKICITLVAICIPIALGRLNILSLSLSLIPALLLTPWNQDKLSSGLFRNREISASSFAGPNKFYSSVNSDYRTTFAKDDPNSTIRIIEREARPSEIKLNHGAKIIRALYVNGKSDGQTSSGDMDTMRLVAHLPGLLVNEEPNNVAVVGLGLGVSAGTIAMYPEVKNVDITEISEALIKVSSLFDFANNSLSTNKKVKYTVGDAYRVLGGSSAKYSIILSEPSNPWVTGVERLYTKEYYEIVKSKLTENGIYTQWFHLYSIDEPTMGIVFSTFKAAFKNTRIFLVGSDIILLGSNNKIAKDSAKRLRERYNSNQFIREDLKAIDIENMESLLALEAWLPTELYTDETQHTLEFPKLAYAAGKDFFMNRDVNYSRISRRQNYAPWVRRNSSNMLFGYYLAEEQNKVDSLINYSNKTCDNISLYTSLPNKLNTLKIECRESTVALSIAGKIDPGTTISDAEINLIKQLILGKDDEAEELQWTNIAQGSSIDDIRKIIYLYNEYDSAFTPLSPKKIILATQKCFEQRSEESDLCKIELIYALANHGWGRLANNSYQRLPKEIKEEKLTVGAQVQSAEEAESRIIE